MKIHKYQIVKEVSGKKGGGLEQTILINRNRRSLS